MAYTNKESTKPWITPHKPAPHARRATPNQKFYNSTAWRKLRKYWINENPLCVHCLEKGITKDATGRNGVVDHIKPINEGGGKLDIENLQTLCNKHHNIKSAKESHKNRK